jgi:four helix bundle protein
MAMRSFRDLHVWQAGMQLVKEVYHLTLAFAHPHRFEIGGQMRDAASSVPSNIAEGYSQRSRKVYLRHLNIAAGSAAELDTQLEIVRSLSIGDSADAARAAATCDRVGRMLNVLITRLSSDPPQS